MAIRKPSWDLSLREINARADALKFNRDYFENMAGRAAAVRADADTLSTEIAAHVYERMADMTPAQLAKISAAVNSGQSVDAAMASLTRADAVSGGLRMIEQRDDSGRPIRTFVLEKGATKMQTWMGRYAAVPQEQVALNIQNLPADVFEAKRGKHLADMQLRERAAAALARGEDVRCDLTYAMERQS